MSFQGLKMALRHKIEKTRESMDNALSPWNCDHCGQEQKFHDPKRTVRLKDKPEKIVTICALCHKRLHRLQRIAGEIF